MRSAKDPEELAGITATEERHLRDRIEALAAQEAKMEHAVDLARDNYATSKAAYEAMLETQDEQDESMRARRQQRVQIGLSVALPVAFMFAGIPLFMHGREITSLSFTALGFFLVLVAVVLAAASLIMLFKPGRKDDERSQRVQDRHWVMLQDKKKLEACLAEQGKQRQAVQAELAAAGLSEAKDSFATPARCSMRRRTFARRTPCTCSASRRSCRAAPRWRSRLRRPAKRVEGLYAEIGMRRERGTLEAVDAFIAQDAPARGPHGDERAYESPLRRASPAAFPGKGGAASMSSSFRPSSSNPPR